MTGKTITITGKDGSFGGYLASPGSGKGPGIVVIQEIFGVNQGLRDIADGLASRGFFALVPDLFWRIKPGIELSDKVEADRAVAFDCLGKFDLGTGITDIQSALDHLRGLPGATGKAGVLGYCLGGQLAYLAAARTDSQASVGYYGIRIEDQLDEAKTIKQPLVLHIAEADDFVPPPAQAKIEQALGGNPLVTLYKYPLMGHAFARVGGMHYDKANADLANVRSQTFFRQHLS
jgi:carboxymethylenebutenolidase